MQIGYITHKKGQLSPIGNSYLEALQKYTVAADQGRDVYHIQEKVKSHMQREIKKDGK